MLTVPVEWIIAAQALALCVAFTAGLLTVKAVA